MFNNANIKRFSFLKYFLASVLWLGSVLAAVPAYSASVAFSGTILDVFVDTGTGVYTGASIGDTFSGNFAYGDSESQASEIHTESNERNWTFAGGAYGGTITNGITPTTGVDAGVDVQNNWVLDADEAVLVSVLVGQYRGGRDPGRHVVGVQPHEWRVLRY